MKQAAGSSGHQIVYKVGKLAGWKFEPWQAVRWANPQSLDEWAELVYSGPSKGAGQAGREVLSPEIRAREGLMLALRSAEGLSLDAYARSAGRELRETHAGLLAQLASTGLATVDGERLRLTRSGMLVSNSVIRALGFEDETNNYS